MRTPRPEFIRWLPFWTLFKKEVLRFMSVISQTLLAPVLTAFLYLFIFGVNLGRQVELFPEFSYVQFVVPGLILMGVITNSFANISSSLFASRYIGNIVEILVTPLRPVEFIWAYTLAAMFRATLVATAVFFVSHFFTELPWAHPGKAVLILLLSSFVFAQFGMVAAIFCRNFDTLAMYTNFLILPMTYLGGLFFPVSQLPSPWREISHLNPVYYLMEGFRHSLLGVGDISFERSFGLAALAAVVLYVIVYRLVLTGYRLRS